MIQETSWIVNEGGSVEGRGDKEVELFVLVGGCLEEIVSFI